MGRVDRPKEFETLKIVDISDKYYTQREIEISKFISQYYFCAIGEALALFIPYQDIKNPISNSSIEISTLPKLSKIQQKVYNELLIKDRVLLFGVTGSGKTEIFISLMADMIKKGKKSIFLMPEISLTPQMKKRLESYFGNRVVVWHSKLTKKEKNRILDDIYRDKINIVAGARSALFTPLKDIGLIIVDEEHDDSYKSIMRPRYNAKDMAIYIGAKIGAKVILASATPSLSSYVKYDVVRLKEPYIKTKKRFKFIRGTTINSFILEEIEKNFKSSNQTLIFLPTRGNFKYLYCPNCGKTHLCPNCSVGMALHRYAKMLKCHYCNHTEPIKESCSYCNYMPLLSNRIGTVEAKEIIESTIKGIVVEQFDKDSITSNRKLKSALERFEKGESHILLGTQMLSKVHDYSNITLSIIMGLDYILGLGDYRSAQRAMSLLFQIAGRSGRAKDATIIIQSSNSEFFERYLDDYENFLKDEIEFMRDLYPPFRYLARIIIAQKDDKKASKITLDTVTKLKEFKKIEIIGHGKAPIEKIASKYRYNILLRSKDRIALIKALHIVNNSKIEIDIDPIDFS